METTIGDMYGQLLVVVNATQGCFYVFLARIKIAVTPTTA
jgi:hypothetical protein